MAKVVKAVALGALVGGITIATGGLGTGLLSTVAVNAGSLAASVGIGLSAVAAGAIAGGVIGGGIAALSSAFSPKARDVEQQSGQKFGVDGSVVNRTILYGENRVGGSLVFAQEYDSNGGNDVPNDTFVFARAVADHVVNGFGQFYIGEQAINFDGGGNATTSPYAGKLFLKTYDGSQTSGADPWLTAADSNWDSTHTGQGVAYYVVKAIYDPEVFPYGASELMNCSIVVQGKKVYDPRLDSTQTDIGGSGAHRIDDESTWAYSKNTALCIYDFLRSRIVDDNAVPDAEIDVASVAAAANTCDETVSVKAGGTIARYELEGVIDRSGKLEALDSMLTAMSGRRMWLGGKIHIFAGESITASVSLGDDDIVSAQYHQMPPNGSRFNEVRGTFVDPSNAYEPQEYPAHKDTTAQNAEGVVVHDLHLPFERDHRRAQRLAAIRLEESRQPMLSLVCKPAAAVVAPMDVIAVTHTDLGLSAENFRVTKQSIDPESGIVTLECIKEDPSVFGWTAASDEKDFNSSSALTQATGRSPFDPTGVTVNPNTLTSLGGLETAVLEVSWDEPTFPYAETIVKWRENGDTTWIPYDRSFRGDNNMTLFLPENTAVDVYVAHVMNNGQESPNPDITTNTTMDGTNIADAITNFNSRNDRDGSSITAPTISGSGTAVDHTIATDGSANVSFEWSWAGDEDDIDGFLVYMRQRTSSSSYNIGGSPSNERLFDVPPSRRAHIVYGVPADEYITFGVQAYRKVDQDVSANGYIVSSVAQPGLGSEDPYRSSSNVEFAGDVTGTIDGGRVDASDVNKWASIDGRTKIAWRLNEKANGSSDVARIRFFGLDSNNFADDTEQAVLLDTGGDEFAFGGNTNDAESTAYSGNDSDGIHYLVCDTSGANSFVHTGTGNTNVGICRSIGGSTLEYFRAQVGWTSLSHDNDFVIFGWAERRNNEFVNVGIFDPRPIDDPPVIYSYVGVDAPNLLPIESVGGVYTLDPSDPLSAADVGSTARISIAATTLYYGDSSLVYLAGTISSLSFNTRYWVYAVDETFSGGSVTYQATTDRTALPARAIYFGSIVTPANGGSGTSGTQGGYAGVGGTYDPDYDIP